MAEEAIVPDVENMVGTVLLAIDTCGPAGGVALGRLGPNANNPVETLSTAGLRGGEYSAHLVTAIQSCLSQAALAKTQIGGLVVVNGPGSFTGVRVGVSVAKGLAEGLNVPVIAISRLEMLAYVAGGSACVSLDAGRGEFYFGVYRDGARLYEALQSELELTDAVRAAGLELVVCEDVLATRLTGARLVNAPTASDALLACAERFRMGEHANPASLDGNYVRRPYAEDPPRPTVAAG